MAVLQRVAPAFPVRDVRASLAHYERLGFATRAVRRGEYGYATATMASRSDLGLAPAFAWTITEALRVCLGRRRRRARPRGVRVLDAEPRCRARLRTPSRNETRRRSPVAPRSHSVDRASGHPCRGSGQQELSPNRTAPRAGDPECGPRSFPSSQLELRRLFSERNDLLAWRHRSRGRQLRVAGGRKRPDAGLPMLCYVGTGEWGGKQHAT